MLDNLTRYLSSIPAVSERWGLRKILIPLYDRQSSLALNSAGLAIHGSASALVKTGAADCYLIANGIPVKIAAATDLPALVGTVATATFNVFCFFVDSGGTKTVAMGTAGTTLAKMVFPPFPSLKALIGFIIVAPTGTGSFVGGTTALDDATVVPAVVYVNPVGGFDPTVLIG